MRRDVAALDRWVEPRAVDGVLVGRATCALPTDLPLGWHTCTRARGSRTGTAVLVVVPDRLEPACAPPGSRAWGLMTQLYQVRSAGSWGIGDLADLASWPPGAPRSWAPASSSSTRCTRRSRCRR